MSATPTRSEGGLAEIRADVLRRPGLVGVQLRAELSDAYDAWLRDVVGVRAGVALMAVGSLGRRQPAPYSDLDLVLLHTEVRGVSQLADSIWYPIWDARVGLDHSVRTPEQALAVAKGDLKALLGLLNLRHIAGDPGVSTPFRSRVLELWRGVAQRRVPELIELARARSQLAGEAAYLLEPNLKESRGGLRDALALHALARAQLVDVPLVVRSAETLLLDVRGELQRSVGRSEDVLRAQEQAAVAKAVDAADADDLLRQVNEAGRAIAFAADSAWRRVRPLPSSGGLRRLGRRGAASARTPLARDVVAQDGEVVLGLSADPWADPLLVLRAARAAAENDLPLAPFALERLAAESAPLPSPWPAAAREEFVSLLGLGRPAVVVLESLDFAGILSRLIPEWELVRFTAQHNPVHRYTVDRHLLETVAEAAELTRTVSRPDLLLLGALLHDVGKGRGVCADPIQHPVAGVSVAERIAARIGLGPDDIARVTALVRHHLLLADTAVRRDLDDPVTIQTVADALAGSAAPDDSAACDGSAVYDDSVEMLELLHALTIADARATGAHVWTDWKAGLVADLVQRVRSLLGSGSLPVLPPLDSRRRQLAEAGQLAVEVDGRELLVAAPDGIGVLSRTAGVLALHSLDVRSASIATHAGTAVNAFVVEPRFGSMPAATVLRGDLGRALSGTLPLGEKLAAKEQSYARGSARRAAAPPLVRWFDDAATDATVLELHADDAIGLLYRVTAALEGCGVDVRSARLTSLGGSVVDAFYLRADHGGPLPPDGRSCVEAALSRVV